MVQVAQFRLNDDARAALAWLYGERWPRQLIQLADWAHEERPGWEWRTVLFEPDQDGFDPGRQCPNNRCALGAVLESRYVLTEDRFGPEAKRAAVQYLMHFITDLHIPVNAGWSDDRGGRAITLETSSLNTVDLHWVWNQGLFEAVVDDWFSQAHRYRRNLSEAEARQWVEPLEPVEWVLESHRLAVEVAYPLAERGRFDAIYLHDARPVLESQLVKAGVRLAALLNDAFSRSSPTVNARNEG